MPESAEMSLRTTRSSTVRLVRAASARRPSSAIPRLTELKIRPDEDEDESRETIIDNPSLVTSNQSMSVYLRLKPRLTRSKKLKKIKDEAYLVTNPTTLLTKFPSLDGSVNPAKKSKTPEATSRKFTFTRIFVPACPQQEFFDQAIKQRAVEFIAGQSYSFMTYGTMNSGKTYTLHGNAESPGIIPRCIEFVFSGVDCTLAPWYKPMNLVDVQSLSETERRQESELREHLLRSRSVDRSLCEVTYGSVANSMKDDRESLKKDSKLRENGAMHSVWLSFAEIYNDNVYDLLADDDIQARLTPLKLAQDKQGRTYVQGLRMICATTGLEAYQIFAAGQSKLTVSSGNPNPGSSRSHSLFTMKLLKYIKEREPQDVEFSAMTFCDLAGTGRSKSTGSGNELKEAKNINKSLLALGRCFKVVLDCQSSKHNVDVGGPFRESKLTRLFQRALSGKENLTLIVNVDTSPDLYVETQSVLNFSMTAKKIALEVGRDYKRLCVPELMITSPKSTAISTFERPATCGLVETSVTEEADNKMAKVKESQSSPKTENAIPRGSMPDFEIRQEVADFYTGIIKKLGVNQQKRTTDAEIDREDYPERSVGQVEHFHKDRFENLTNGKRRRASGGDEIDDGRTLLDELVAENAQIADKIITLRETIKDLKKEVETIGTDKNKCVFELGLAKDELRQIRKLLDEERGEEVVINDETALIDELRNLFNEKNGMIRSLQKRLEIARNGAADVDITGINCDQSESKVIGDSSVLNSIRTEDLEDELRKRNVRVSGIPDAESAVEIEVPEQSGAELAGEVETKFSSLTFRKVNYDSSRKCTMIAAQDSMIEEKTSCTVIPSRSPSIDPQTNDVARDLHSSFFETIDKVFASSDEINVCGDDSGINVVNSASSSTDNSLRQETPEKNMEPRLRNDDNHQMIQDRLEQLKLDYTKLKAEHLHETMRVTELSQELECIQYALGDLKTMTRKNEEKIIQYQERLASRDNDLTNLGRAKSDIQTRLIRVSTDLEARTMAYEKKIADLSEKLVIREEIEARRTKSLEEYMEKSSSLEIQLYDVRAELDETSLRCFTEHLPTIERLERELSVKNVRVNELDGRVSEMERDLARVAELSEKVTDFEMILEKCQSEKAELGRQLTERSKMQFALECKLKKLTSKAHERENEISSLRTDLVNVGKMNMENSERASELSRDIVEALGRLDGVKGEMTRSEDERRKLDKTSGHEIGNLIARLADFEKNAPLLARMRDNEDSRMDELDRVKLLLHKKEREMCLFKKNRDKTIRRYDALIRKLQADAEPQPRCNRESSKLRMLYPKSSLSRESLRSLTGSLRWKSTLHQSVEKVRESQGAVGERNCNRWKVSKRCSCAHLHPTCSRIVKRSSSRAYVASTTSLEGSRSSESKQFFMRDDDDDDEDDECVGHELIETESREELNMDIHESRSYSRREELSQAAATFSIPSSSDDSFSDIRNIPEWMEIRRTNGRTHFRLRNGDSCPGNGEKPRM